MQGSIVQVLSLAIHGNAALRGWTNASFFSDNSSCKFCKSISFILLEPDPKQPSEVNFSNNPDEWFARQAARGAAGYRVSWEPRHPGPKASDRMLVGLVGGGGHWRLETLFADSFESWEPCWRVGDQKDRVRQIWLVTYTRVVWNRPVPALRRAILEAHVQDVQKVLTQASAFARRHQLISFAECFERGLACLSSGDPLAEVFHKDIAPAGVLPLVAERLLAAAQAAWVFGGMGSWNDVVFQGAEHEEYEHLSERLYHCLNQAAIDAANASLEGHL